MQLPSARPNETVREEFTVANSYTTAQVIVAILVPVIFYGLYLGALQIGILNGFEESFRAVAQSVFVFVGLVLGLYLVLSAIYLRLARHYFVTNERIIQVIGWLAQSSISIEYASITDMTVNQDVFERFLITSGTLNIDTAGSPSDEIMLHHIAKPYQLRDEIFGYAEVEEKGTTATQAAKVAATTTVPGATNVTPPQNPPTTPVQ